MLTCHPRDNMLQWSTVNCSGSTVDLGATIEVTLDLPDVLIDWLPYHYKKYLPTWHLVRSYD